MMSKSRNTREIDVAQELGPGRGPMAEDSEAKRRAPGVRLFMLVIIVVAVALGGVLTWKAWQHKQAKEAEGAARKAKVENTLPPFIPTQPPGPGPEQQREKVEERAPSVEPPREKGGKREKYLEELIEERRLSGGFQGGNGGMEQASAQSVLPSLEKQGEGGGESPLVENLRPLRLEGAKAGLIPDRDFFITKGTLIDCGRQTRLITDQPGLVTCYTTTDTYSANGRVVLIDAGSKVTGYSQRGITQGQSRVFVAWERIETPQGVIIDVNSPGAGPLGGAGEEGYIDKHFWDRFGGAIMLSLLSDAGQAAIIAAQSGNSTIYSLNQTESTADQMATEVLRNTLNIPPTLYAPQGGRVKIFVARDLDFSSVYALK